jgi:hypothetical protein
MLAAGKSLLTTAVVLACSFGSSFAWIAPSVHSPSRSLATIPTDSASRRALLGTRKPQWQLNIFKTASASTSTSAQVEQDVKALLTRARQLGPIGANQGQEIQDDMTQQALKLTKSSTANPARLPLQGVHRLVYSHSAGASSGKLWGPLVGAVTQYFIDDTRFENRVQFGPLQIALSATRQPIDNQRVRVSFQKTTISLFGNKLVEKEASGSGVWKYLYAGVINDGGKQKLVRVMETPRLFILEHDITSS